MMSSLPEAATSPFDLDMSVIVLTYNQEKFISQALESVLSQRDAEHCEILVADDCSTDGTTQRIDQIELRYPGRMRRLSRTRNLGLSANLEDAFRQCRGRYISILEGDDFWVDPQKLSKSIAALNQHPEWAGCCHSVRILYDSNYAGPQVTRDPPQQGVLTLQDLIANNYVHTYSAVTYRRGLVTCFPQWHRRIACGDFALHLLHAQHGDFGYLFDEMTAYRIHSRSLWNSASELFQWKQMHDALAYLDVYFEGRYSEEIQAARHRWLERLHEELTRARRTEQRYHRLQLHRVAATVKWFKDLVTGAHH